MTVEDWKSLREILKDSILDDNSVVGAERINDNKKVKLLDKRPIFLKFITPEQKLKSDAIHN